MTFGVLKSCPVNSTTTLSPTAKALPFQFMYCIGTFVRLVSWLTLSPWALLAAASRVTLKRKQPELYCQPDTREMKAENYLRILE
jgi:hypothetical protein